MRILFPIALTIATVAAPGAARDRNAVPAATPAGEPQSCIPIRSIRESLVRNDRVIDFRVDGNRYYRVTLPQSCPQLGFERRFSYATSLSQLCAQDIITVFTVNPPMRGASCGLAPFQPVKLTK
ncbi:MULTISPECIES: hypothetical protein [unclassified Sphingomonas]|uniref:hypothetical protein n=1 Tax=unclassified Sphingomonas TaxID=196159 RepID=UPI001D118D5D|nr:MULTISPECIES: hypothetical protein [unclassified Sphingomonas]MCC2979400.1 hypothetical protein [Sphingomonas sp. IC4-52]MCD2315372.1 hypothetical protein [Sphingomonas sp. IC-11]